MTTIEYICKNCPWTDDDVGPFSEDATGSDDKPIIKFHRDKGHNVIEYEENVFTTGREITNDFESIHENTSYNKIDRKKDDITKMVLILEDHHFINRKIEQFEQLYVYDNGVYIKDTSIIEKECEIVFPDCTTHFVNEVRNKLARRNYEADKKLKSTKNKKCFKNYIYDFDNDCKLEHSPEYFFRSKIPVIYDPTKIPKEILGFLKRIFELEDGFDVRGYVTLLESGAVCLLDDDNLQLATIAVGEGSNGKTTWYNILENFFGSKNIANLSIREIENDRFALIGLFDAIVNICGDIDAKEITTTGNIKKIIGGDSVRVQQKGQPAFNMRTTAKLFFSCNRFPEVKDQSDGFFRRWNIIEFLKQFKKDRTLFVKLITEEELSGLLNIFISLIKGIIKRGDYLYNEEIGNLRDSWNKKANSVNSFCNEILLLVPEEYTANNVLYPNYRGYCKENKLIPENNRNFNEKLRELGLIEGQKKIDGVNTRVWYGCTFKGMMKDSTLPTR